MPTRNIANKANQTVASITYAEATRAWGISSKAEPNFQQSFTSERDAFDFWHARFDPETGKLK
jgi:hypothetical protein